MNTYEYLSWMPQQLYDDFTIQLCIAEDHNSKFGPICRREFLRIYELMKLRIFDTETNWIQSQIYYDPANVCIMPKNIEINISEIDL